MDGLEPRQLALNKLLLMSEKKGYSTFDDILDVGEAFALSLEDIAKVSDLLMTKGLLIRDNDKEPIVNEDEYISDRSKLDYDKIFSEVLSLDPGLESYIESLKWIPPPQLREANRLIYQAQEGNLYAYNRLVLMYLKVVVRISLWASLKYKMSIADTIQYGSIGLIIAVNKYEPSGEGKFSTYAPWWVRQNILRENSFANLQFYFPVHIKDKLYAITDIVQDHYCAKCKKYSICENLIQESMEKIDVDEETADQYIRHLQPMLSIEDMLENFEDKVFSDEEQQNEDLLSSLSTEQCLQEINIALKELRPRERTVILYRFGFESGEPMTLEEVGSLFGVTRERIRQIEGKALRKLRHPTRSKKLKLFL